MWVFSGFIKAFGQFNISVENDVVIVSINDDMSAQILNHFNPLP